ncbi:helix-turn-helix domain-containing protein [Natrinema salifodinae]|uniref:HTH DNA binding domain-containing protein n=1 Tax=Natrinema salifodinae TaxID=1202768 RepID=A0A1I0NBR5_9EURY|nr:helix-turn-helix domain-containing protein [Natrinema salifodinae]SEV98435.1 HTH DNA binding domain-containing protein [Natrinema salifodinae]
MREFAFTIEYDKGADPLMDVFIEYPDAHARTISCHMSPNGVWRVDRIAGPEEALERIDEIYTAPEHCNECIGSRHCHTNWEHEILESNPSRRTIYTYRPSASDCHSVLHLACIYLGEGIVPAAERRGNRYEWRILMRDDADASGLHEALNEELRDGLRVNFRQIGGPSYWAEEAISLAELPHEQREAIEAAVRSGYYETPRNASMADIAEVLDIPRSTLQYRLQRAESWIIGCFVSRSIADIGDEFSALPMVTEL